VYGENVMNRQNVAKWCCEFEGGRNYVHDGRPSVVIDEIIQKTDENICADRRLTTDELHQQCPEVSRTVFHETVTKRLGYQKLCIRWVSKMLTDYHKKYCVAMVQAFLACYEDQCDNFPDCIVTGDEIWAFHHTPENKQQSMQWRHTHSPTAKKLKTSPSNRKIMTTIFFNVLLAIISCMCSSILVFILASRSSIICCASIMCQYNYIVPCWRYLLGYTIHHSVCDTVLLPTLLVGITISLYNQF
jgi:hypothetical protein